MGTSLSRQTGLKLRGLPEISHLNPERKHNPFHSLLIVLFDMLSARALQWRVTHPKSHTSGWGQTTSKLEWRTQKSKVMRDNSAHRQACSCQTLPPVMPVWEQQGDYSV